MRVMNRLRIGAIALVTIVMSVLMAAPPASATALAYQWNNRGSYVPMYYAPTTATNVKVWSRNGTKFLMICWTDWQWATGNYTSNRWFYGETYSTGSYGYVHSSYVNNQGAVPRC